MRGRYDLSFDARAMESQNGQVALKRNLGSVYSELGEIATAQSKLASYLPQLRSIAERSGMTWGEGAGWFARGAIVAANPLIGVPLLLVKYFTDREARKQAEAFLNRLRNEFVDYLNDCGRLVDLHMPVAQDQARFIEDRLKRILEVTMPRILKDLADAGFSLKDVPGAYDDWIKSLLQ